MPSPLFCSQYRSTKPGANSGAADLNPQGSSVAQARKLAGAHTPQLTHGQYSEMNSSSSCSNNTPQSGSGCFGTNNGMYQCGEVGHRHPPSENKQINVTHCPSAISTDAVVNKSEVSRNSLNNFYYFFFLKCLKCK